MLLTVPNLDSTEAILTWNRSIDTMNVPIKYQ